MTPSCVKGAIVHAAGLPKFVRQITERPRCQRTHRPQQPMEAVMRAVWSRFMKRADAAHLDHCMERVYRFGVFRD